MGEKARNPPRSRLQGPVLPHPGQHVANPHGLQRGRCHELSPGGLLWSVVAPANPQGQWSMVADMYITLPELVVLWESLLHQDSGMSKLPSLERIVLGQLEPQPGWCWGVQDIHCKLVWGWAPQEAWAQQQLDFLCDNKADGDVVVGVRPYEVGLDGVICPSPKHQPSHHQLGTDDPPSGLLCRDHEGVCQLLPQVWGRLSPPGESSWHLLEDGSHQACNI